MTVANYRPPDKFQVRVLHLYIPEIDTKVPGYGISGDTHQVVVALSVKAPSELVPLLEKDLRSKLRHFTPYTDSSYAMFVDRLTLDFLNTRVMSGNLRYDAVADVWRWIPPVGPNPADSSKDDKETP